jgi:peptidyl-prolyl cis-trans isomerase SurA
MIKKIFLLFTFMVLLPCLVQAAPVNFDIVALVNDEVITRRELNNRMKIAFHATKLPDKAETRAKLTPQLLQIMIDERLQRQEAKKLEIKMTDTEAARARSELEKQNNVPTGKLDDYIAKQGLDKDAILAQVESQILWTKVIYKKIRPQIKLSDQEVKDAVEKAKVQIAKGVTEMELAEIVLPVANKDEEQNVQQLAAKLFEELSNGADFASVAKEFSTSSTSDTKGVIGWLALEDLEPTLRQALDGLEVGKITLPVRSPRGYLILKVLNKKEKASSTASQAEANPDEGRIRDFLTLRKMELEARRYIASLRDKAYIEKRL